MDASLPSTTSSALSRVGVSVSSDLGMHLPNRQSSSLSRSSSRFTRVMAESLPHILNTERSRGWAWEILLMEARWVSHTALLTLVLCRLTDNLQSRRPGIRLATDTTHRLAS